MEWVVVRDDQIASSEGSKGKDYGEGVAGAAFPDLG